MPFVYGALTRYGVPFQNTSTRQQFCNSAKGLVPLPSTSHDPDPATPPGLTLARFRLIPFRSPLLRESLLLSSPRGTEMFQFPRFPLPALCVQTGVTPHDGCRVSPFGHPRIEAWSAAPRGFSQPPTSFIGFRRQGIHRWLFVAWRIRCSCSLWSSQGTYGRGNAAPWKRNRNSPTHSPEPDAVGCPRPKLRHSTDRRTCRERRLTSDRLGDHDLDANMRSKINVTP